MWYKSVGRAHALFTQTSPFVHQIVYAVAQCFRMCLAVFCIKNITMKWLQNNSDSGISKSLKWTAFFLDYFCSTNLFWPQRNLKLRNSIKCARLLSSEISGVTITSIVICFEWKKEESVKCNPLVFFPNSSIFRVAYLIYCFVTWSKKKI